MNANVLVYALGVVVLFYGVVTVARNAVWKNDITLFSDVVRKSPGNLLANYNLGIWYANARDYQNSVVYYQRAIEKAPEFWEARYNLGNIYLKFGKDDAAKEQYSYVLKINPKYISAKNILDNLDPLQQATTSAVPVSDDLFTPYTTKGKLKFWFPIFWSLKEDKGVVKLGDINTPLQVDIFEVKTFREKDQQEYIENQKESLGTLVNGGPAQIPNLDMAYVRVWNKPIEPFDAQGKPIKTDLTDSTESAQISDNAQNQLVLLQFFLFKGNKVVEIRVWPADFIKVNGIFDSILSTVNF
ncbi:MAG: hypothetical protein A3A85_01210 [Deltaproteobacteria bacterium RIFCSPLOWO2_01_FULL_42_9]|nr:MAG: hypothetical protein A3A85_01210 [Deltaproteobacteria bacterium RIFCSPLOWO2_01_FULL_42_9]